jgi:sarcosine oxidase
MENITTDIAVVGLGAFGAGAMWRLAERGVDVVGIDRYGLGHHLGSSHGTTRLFRVACQEHPGLAPIARKSRELLEQLGRETGQSLIMTTGCLSVGAPDTPPIAGTKAAAAEAGITLEELDHDQLLRRFPQFTGTDERAVGVIDPEAGVCFPERDVRAQGEAAVRAGARVLADTRVTGIELLDDGVRVATSVATVRARQVIVAAGAWNPKLIPGLPLTPRRTPLFWWDPKPGHEEEFAMPNFPAVVHDLPDGRRLWGHGSYDGPEGTWQVKIGMDGEYAEFAATDADELDRYIHPREDLGKVSSWVADAFDGIEPMPSRTIPCMVTHSPDAQFLIGRPGGDPRLVVAGGDSGHGFKHTAGIGELLAQIALGEDTYTDVSFMDPDRFAEVPAAVAALPRG